MNCCLRWFGVNPDCKRMFDHVTMVFANHKRKMGYKAVPIFQHAMNTHPKLFVEVSALITAAIYVICEVIVQFDTQLGNI